MFGDGAGHTTPLIGDFDGNVFATFGDDDFDGGESGSIVNSVESIVVMFGVIFFGGGAGEIAVRVL